MKRALLEWGIFPALLAMVLASGALAAPAKRALVIGNGAYAGDLALRNPVNDATDVAASLREVGFTVNLQTNLDLAGMEDALVEFRRSLEEGDVALFFYAGHGLEVDGKNYLVPIGARIRESFEVKRQAMDVSATLDAMKDSGAKLNVLVLDCCRDNPLKRSWAGRSTAARNGLASINAPEGTLIAYSTAPGEVAADGNSDSRNSPYSAALIKALRERSTQSLELKEVFFTASREVKKATGQTPWIALEASLEPYYLVADSASFTVTNSPPAPTQAPPASSALPPAPAAPSPPTTPASLAEIFNGTSYDLHNTYSKTQILKAAQDKLRNAGVYPGPADGATGEATHSALVAWQQEQGLPATGRLDVATLTALGLNGIPEKTEPPAKPQATPAAKPKASAPKPSAPKPRPASTPAPNRNSDFFKQGDW